MARSENMAIIIGNLTRDPDLRYTPGGHAVCSFGVATNRVWQTAGGEQKESVEFHNVVAWNKLAEICSQLLSKGRKVYIKGRLQTRSWEGQEGVKRYRTEIVAEDMVVLDSRPAAAKQGEPSAEKPPAKEPPVKEKKKEVEDEEPKGEEEGGREEAGGEEVESKEIPF